ncbi:MAG: hypothetical protein ABII06_19425 [Pseudomonadota bacterium]
MEKPVKFPLRKKEENPAPSKDKNFRKGIAQEFFLAFRHQDLLKDNESAPRVKKRELINILNFITFTGGFIYLHLQHTRFKRDFILRAFPFECSDDLLYCRLPEGVGALLQCQKVVEIITPNDPRLILSPVTLQRERDDTVALRLPEESIAVNSRQRMRYPCKNITAAVTQNAFHATGELIDFCPSGLCIALNNESLSSIHWLNPEEPIMTELKRHQQMFFSSPCRLIRHDTEEPEGRIVLAPIMEHLPQFKKKEFRNLRQELQPLWTIVFEHPFLGKNFQRKIVNLSTSGFSAWENGKDSVLLTGMILPKLSIKFAGMFALSGITAQVIYRDVRDDGTIRCGLAILDMDVKTYSSLSHILANTLDPHVCIANDVDLDELWKFFFETGFIYPEKYRDIHEQQEEFRKTYQKLYKENPEIARHFLYQKDSRICGHISLVRAYEKTWLFHHLAANNRNSLGNGINLLKQIIHFTKELYRMPSAKMDFLICYFRPQNRFSSRLFGDFSAEIGEPRVCSLDLFSYMVHRKRNNGGNELPEGWVLRDFSREDQWEFAQVYDQLSGGLLIKVLHLEQRSFSCETFTQVYERLGFTRRMSMYSLLNNGTLAAVIILNQTNVGLNLSNLLNCIKVIVCDRESLPGEILERAIDTVAASYAARHVPVLLYPSDYADKKECFHVLKEYVMWIFDTRYVSEYMAFTKKKYKIKYWAETPSTNTK